MEEPKQESLEKRGKNLKRWRENRLRRLRATAAPTERQLARIQQLEQLLSSPPSISPSPKAAELRKVSLPSVPEPQPEPEPPQPEPEPPQP